MEIQPLAPVWTHTAFMSHDLGRWKEQIFRLNYSVNDAVFHPICKSINQTCVYIYMIHFLWTFEEISCWIWVREFGILEGWRQILHCEAETGAAALLFWIKPSSLSQCLQNRVSSAPILVSIHATYFFFRNQHHLLRCLLYLGYVISLSTPPPQPGPPPPLVAFWSQCIFLLFSILINLSAICTRLFLCGLFYIIYPDCSLKNTPCIHFLTKGLSPTRRELAGSHLVNTERRTGCTVPDDYYFRWSPSGSYLPHQVTLISSSFRLPLWRRTVMTTAARGVHSPASISTCLDTISRMDCLRRSQSAKESLQLAANCSSWFAEWKQRSIVHISGSVRPFPAVIMTSCRTALIGWQGGCTDSREELSQHGCSLLLPWG